MFRGRKKAVLAFVFLLFIFGRYIVGLPRAAVGQIGLPAGAGPVSKEEDEGNQAAAAPELAFSEPILSFQNGWAYVVGEVENVGSGALAWVRIEASFTKESGGILAREYTYINHLNPGQIKPYRLLLPEEEPIAGVEVICGGGFPAETRDCALLGEVLRVSRAGGGFLHITGRVTNQGGEEIDFAKVIVKLVGAEGQVVAVNYSFLADLKPGRKREFTSYCQGGEGYQSVGILFD